LAVKKVAQGEERNDESWDDIELEAWGECDWVKACREVSWEDSGKGDEEAESRSKGAFH
jgi:hypothetical protein